MCKICTKLCSKLELVKSHMLRSEIELMGIGEMQLTGTGHFNRRTARCSTRVPAGNETMLRRGDNI